VAETVRADFSQLQGLLKDLELAAADVSRVMPVLAEALHFEVMEVFDKEGAVGGASRWPPLAPYTLKRRRKSKSPKILQDTTNLIGNIMPDHGDGFVEAWTNVPYATFHVSKAPRRYLPLRDFFAIDQAAFIDEATDILTAVLTGRV
jgi:phage gpG-like protein